MATLTAFLDQIPQFPHTCAFRGQTDSNWELQSAATRRLVKHVGTDITHRMDYPRVHASYHIDELIEPARTAGFGIEDGYELSDLQLLAKLQHFGAATGLIDFSWNPLVALWFACNRSGADDGDGRVFVAHLNDPSKFERVSHKPNEQELDHIFPSQRADKPLYWEPTVVGAATQRILRQRSVFVMGRPLIPTSAFNVIDIPAANKEAFRKELEEQLDLSAQTLFVDIHGFSTANGAEAPIRLAGDPRLYVLRGNQLAQQSKYAEAIETYDRCIQLDPNVREPYFLRGNAKAARQDFTGAREDYNLALARSARPYHNLGPNITIVNDLDLSMILFNRGNVKAAAPDPDYKGALRDYDEAIKHQIVDLGLTVFFNRANVKAILGLLDDAIQDYDEAIHRGSQNGRFNKGNVLVKLGRFAEAQRCYAELVEQGDTRPHLLANETAVRAILNRIDGREFETKLVNQATLRICVSGDRQEQTAFFPICGNIGNTGNFGGANAPSGPGFEGDDGFCVIVEGQT